MGVGGVLIPTCSQSTRVKKRARDFTLFHFLACPNKQPNHQERVGAARRVPGLIEAQRPWLLQQWPVASRPDTPDSLGIHRGYLIANRQRSKFRGANSAGIPQAGPGITCGRIRLILGEASAVLVELSKRWRFHASLVGVVGPRLLQDDVSFTDGEWGCVLQLLWVQSVKNAHESTNGG